ncbi:MAG: TrbC/VirB2 family protein, partial [Patescibacteria group bacterium]|nr:TrbC/VirB2 family protein [Patescibacteria group bacterium]
LPNPLGTGSIPELLARIITIFTAIAGSVALLMFVYGGIMWLSSGGNKERIETGKKAVVYAVIGLAIIFGSYAILRALFTAIGARL